MSPAASAGRQRAAFAPHDLALAAAGCALLSLFFVARPFTATTATISTFVKLALLQCALHSFAAFVAWRASASRATFPVVVAFAALFRLAILFEPPRLSDDIYRYVWDGRVAAAGINPYRYVPSDDALKHLRDAAVYEHVNRRDFAPTIYPPLAQMIFLAATRVSESVVWMKAVMVSFEAVALWAVARLLASYDLPRQRILLAAWHPLLVWEIAGGGHLDAVMICFVCLALRARRRGRDARAVFLLACAALTKLFPAVLAPALYRRGWKTPAVFAVTFVAGYLPYSSVGLRRVVGYLPGYAAEEGLSSGARFYVLALARKLTGQEIPAHVFLIFALAALAALAAWTLPKREGPDQSFVTRALVLATAFTALLSPHYSWYFVWLVPLLSLAPTALVAPVLYLTAASFVLYLTWLGDQPERMFALNSIIYLPFAALCVAARLLLRARGGAVKSERPAGSFVD
ncbi:MAG TPA: glycosyltransferase 87 family protein [Pyrinomonadaceae bacterium]|nr:glycosyltransferase 87 family protein [Pyrinomonadaceae bacterium]